MGYTVQLRFLFTTFAISLLFACSDGSDIAPITEPVLALAFTTAPIDLPGIATRYAEDVPYGDRERNFLDIYLPDCNEPTPLVIFIHGGGFIIGDKSTMGHAQRAEEIEQFLQACIAYATINYTLLSIPLSEEDLRGATEQGGIQTSLDDAARALQFLRYYHDSLHIDPKNVALFGVSAGAGASLWLGTHDDLADPSSSDPVLRESTRVKAVGAISTQSTYDFLRWETILLPFLKPLEAQLGGTDIESFSVALGAGNFLLAAMGVASFEELASPENAAYRANLDMLSLMDSGDAPIYAYNRYLGFNVLLNSVLHHGLHAVALKNRADEVGLNSVIYVDDPDFGQQDPSDEELAPFLIRHIR